MIAKKLLTTIAFAFVLLFSGCAEDDFVGVDGLCPLVVSTVPDDGDVDVPLNQIITATFNEKMNPATITETSFTVSLNGVNIKGTVSYNGLTATFRPESLLEPNTKYTGTITTMAKDERGNALQENYVWTFTTLPEFLVTITTNPTPGPITTGAGIYLKGTAVTVTAAPYANYTFTNWTIGGVLASNLATYTLPPLMGNVALVANYTLVPYEIKLIANPTLGGNPGGGGFYNFGTTNTVTANPNAGYTFTNWTEAGVVIPNAGASYTFVLTGNRTLVANYSPNIVLSANPPAGGSATGAGTYLSGTTRTVTATANANYTFSNWTENNVIVPGAGANYTFVLTVPRTLVANFVLKTYPLNVTIVGSGSVTKSPLNGPYNHGSTVTLTPLADNGWVFSGWSVDASGSSNPLLVTMDGPKNITATFTAVIPQLTITLISDTNQGTTLGAGTFPSGATKTVEAIAKPGYIFSNWTENNVIVPNAGANYTFVLTQNRTLTANFTPVIIQPPVNAGLCNPNAVNLGMARNYAILAQTAITTTGVTSITGNMGISPNGASSIEGFSLIRSVDGTYSNSILVAGRVYASDYTTPTPTNVGTAVGDMGTAYTTANGMAPNFTEHLDGDFNNIKLDPGVYKFGTGLSLTNTITLDGGGTDCAIFVFNIAGSLTVNPNTKIILTGGAKADNIYWVVAGAGATLNTDVDFSGTILAEKLISLAQRTVVNGRLLSQTAVTLIGNTVVMPSN